jgi:nucleotide-binding universal stress UspA family protein
MFKRILCPYDFTEHASRGLAYAVRLARRFRGQLEIVTVRPATPGGTATLPRPLSRMERLTLERELEEAGGTGPLPADARVVIGRPASDITTVAHHDRADLVVMGTHADPTAISPDGSPASITFQVLGRTSVPVLAVPPAAPDPGSWLLPGGEVIIGIDFAEACTAEIVEATTVVRFHDGHLLLVHVIDPRPSAGDWGEQNGATSIARMARARASLERLLAVAPPGVTTSGLLLIGDPAEELAAIARERHAALVITGLRNPGSLLRPPQGSIAYRVLCLAAVPVLALPPAPTGDYSLFKRRRHEDHGPADGRGRSADCV